jgi:ERCC4-related helicase|tara:strand:- start:2362 stop:3786 length:1425 start_codon:yes stop_codon:yes gene_type:complete
MQKISFKPREYQKRILDITSDSIDKKQNVLIELDCGLGKRYLQYSLLFDIFSNKNILLILQASTSLYETYEYLKSITNSNDIAVVDSRMNSQYRSYIMNTKRIILCLPQTISNTIKKYPQSINKFDLIIINEVDQIIRRMSYTSALKQPYSFLIPIFQKRSLIGMSGTLRDEHYIVDDFQLKIIEELNSLITYFHSNTKLITMNMLNDTDIGKFVNISDIIPTGIYDSRMTEISEILDSQIEKAKNTILNYIREDNITFYNEIKRDLSKLFGPLPIPPIISQKFHRGYLVRKYLWSMSGDSSYRHLLNYGLSKHLLKNTLPRLPGKFLAVKELVKNYKKSIILCSYIDTVELLAVLLEHSGLQTIIITGQVPQNQRITQLEDFRKSNTQSVAILSNVGERDLDIPEADMLIIFDLVRTTKTVYQKLKRSRGGEVRLLFYENTNEKKKVVSVLHNISKKYPWSVAVKDFDTKYIG